MHRPPIRPLSDRSCFCWQASHDRPFLLQEAQHHPLFSHIMLLSNTTSSSFFTYYVASQWCKNQHHPLFSHIALSSNTFNLNTPKPSIFSDPCPPENSYQLYNVNFLQTLHFWSSGLPRRFWLGLESLILITKFGPRAISISFGPLLPVQLFR